MIFIIGFLFTPIIARVYSPDAYGTFALYSSIVMNLGILLGMRIPSSFVNIHNERKFQLTVQTLLGFVIVGVCIICLIFYLFEDLLFANIENKSLLNSWHLIGLGVFFHFCTDLFGNWNVRERAFRQSTTVAMSETLGTKIGSLSIGLIAKGIESGLIYGEIFGKFLHIILQIPLFIKGRIHYLIPQFSPRRFKWLVQEFKEYPIYLLPSTWLSQTTNAAVIIYLSSMYSAQLVGSYSMAIGLVAIPVMLIAYASQPILMQKVAQLTQDELPIDKQIRKFINVILIISIPILIGGMLLGEVIINKFLGDGWQSTAQFVSWMIPLIGVQFLMMPLSGVLIGMKKNKEVLIANLTRLVGMIIVFLIAPQFSISFVGMIKFLILGSLLSYIAPLILIFRLINIAFDRRIITLLVIYIFASIVGYFYTGYL